MQIESESLQNQFDEMNSSPEVLDSLRRLWRQQLRNKDPFASCVSRYSGNARWAYTWADIMQAASEVLTHHEE